MDLEDVLLLAITAAILCVGIVIAVMQSRILKLLSRGTKIENEAVDIKPETRKQNIAELPVATDLTRGETKLSGVDSDELTAVIMAAVSSAANIPLAGLRIKYIKRIEG